MFRPRGPHRACLALVVLALPLAFVQAQDGEKPPPDPRRITGKEIGISFVPPIGHTAEPPERSGRLTEFFACVEPGGGLISVTLFQQLPLTRVAAESFARSQLGAFRESADKAGRRLQVGEPSIHIGRWSKDGVSGREAQIRIPLVDAGVRLTLFSMGRSGPGGQGLIVTAQMIEGDLVTTELVRGTVRSAEFPAGPPGGVAGEGTSGGKPERFVGRSIPISFQPLQAGVQPMGGVEGTTEVLQCPAPGGGNVVVTLSRELALKPATINVLIKSQKRSFAAGLESEGIKVEFVGEPTTRFGTWSGGSEVEIVVRFRAQGQEAELFTYGRMGPGRLGIMAMAQVATHDSMIREEIRDLVRSASFPEIAAETPAAAAAEGQEATLVGERIPVRVKLPAGWSARVLEGPSEGPVEQESYRLDEPVGRGVILQFSRHPEVMDRAAVEDYVRGVKDSTLQRFRGSGANVSVGAPEITLEPRGKGVRFEARAPFLLDGEPMFVLLIVGSCDENGTAVIAAGRQEDPETPVILRRMVHRAIVPWLPKPISRRQKTEKSLKGAALRLVFMLILVSFGAVIGGWIPTGRRRVLGASLGGILGLMVYLGLVILGEVIAGEALLNRPEEATLVYELGFAMPCGLINGLLFLVGVAVLLFSDSSGEDDTSEDDLEDADDGYHDSDHDA